MGSTQSTVPVIDLACLSDRRQEVAQQLLQAAVDTGFFYLKNHSIPLEEIQAMFAASASFFSLPDSVKDKYAFENNRNAGWEKLAQATCLVTYRALSKSADRSWWTEL